MKLQTILLLVVLLISFSCKTKSSDEDKSNETEITLSDNEVSVDEDDTEEIKDCDDFIDQYEEWSDEYIAFMSKYKDNPMKAVTSPEYSQMMLKASSWSQEWLSISVSCAQNSSYSERVEEISDRMEKKIEELGFK